MEEKIYFADYITDSLKSELDNIKEKYNNCFIDYLFIFVNTDKCSSIKISDKNLQTTKIEDFDFSKFVVFLRYVSNYCGYENTKYNFIGIYDKQCRESTLYYKNIKLVSLSTKADFNNFHYDADLVHKINIILKNNPFESYLGKMLKPVKKAINVVLPENDYKKEYLEDFDIEREEIPLTICMGIWSSLDINFFDSFLEFLKQIDNNIEEEFGSTFKPEKYMK